MKKSQVLWSLAASLLMSGASYAQGSADQPGGRMDAGTLEEIVVTAQKRAENLQNVPIAVSVISGEQLQAAGITDSLQLATVTPGFAVMSQAEYFQPHLRGIGTSSNGPGVENPVALYVDGVYYGSQVMAPHDLFDVTQVSVLKGPQGTLFGRNATAGVIQMATKDPRQAFEGVFQTDLDNYLTTRSHLYLSGGLADDVAANISLQYAYQADGWGTNLHNGDDVERTIRDLGGRSKWLYTPTSATTIKFSLDFSDLVDNSGLCIAPVPGTLNLVPGYRPSGNPWNIDSDLTCRTETKHGGASVTIDQNLSFAQLVSISAYRRYTIEPVFSITASPNPGESLNIRANGEQLTEELQLISPSNQLIDWTAGLYYFYSADGHGPPGLQVFLAGPLAPTPFSVGQLDITTHLVTNSAAGFGQATFHMLPSTDLTVGLRYTYERKTLTGSEQGFLANGTSIGYFPLPAYSPSESFSKPTWRLALGHKFMEDHLGYVSYNRGYKSGGYNGNDPTNLPYGPEILDAYEVGLKNEWLGHHLTLNAAGFYYDYKNIQVSRYETTEQIYNGARAKLHGIDLDGRARLTDRFTVTGGFEWLHSTFTNFPNAQFAAPLPAGGAVFYTGDASGNELPLAPNFTVNIGGDYVWRVGGSTVDLNITDYFNSGYFTESDNNLRQSAYDYLNASATLHTANDAFSVKLWANNLLDKAVYSFAVTQPVSYNAVFGNPPRTYGVTFRYKF